MRQSTSHRHGIVFSQRLRDEMAYLLVQSEDATLADVLRRMCEDCDIKGHPASDFRRELRDIMIAVGVLVPISDEQIAGIVSTGRQRYPKIRGQRYDFASWAPLDRAEVLEYCANY